MNAYVPFMNAIAADEEMKHSTQACNTKVPLKNQTMLRTVKKYSSTHTFTYKTTYI